MNKSVPFEAYYLADLTAVNDAGAPAWPTLSDAYAIINQGGQGNGLGYVVPANQVLRIKHIIPVAYARQNVDGTDTQSLTAIPSAAVCGQFIFRPVVGNSVGKWQLGGAQPGITNFAATANNTQTDMKVYGGIYGVVDSPLDVLTIARSGEGRGLDITVPGGRAFNVLFSIVPPSRGPAGAPVSVGNPLDSRFVVGQPAAGTTQQRVDFAGVYLLGELQ